METKKRDPLTLKCLTQEFRDVLFQLKDDELLAILERYQDECQRLLRLIKVSKKKKP
jgi:hypothetical protein